MTPFEIAAGCAARAPEKARECLGAGFDMEEKPS